MGRTPLRIGLVILVILLLVGAGGGIYWYLHQTSSNTQTMNTTSTTNTDSGVIPASTAPFKAFSNTEAYRFTVSYPSDWTISTNQEGTLLMVSFDYQVDAGPDAYPLEIDCDANPNELTAQQWSETQQQLTSQGPQKLANGLEVFVATGMGEGAYTAYSVVQGQQACTLFAFTTDTANTALINKVINTFAWHA